MGKEQVTSAKSGGHHEGLTTKPVLTDFSPPRWLTPPTPTLNQPCDTNRTFWRSGTDALAYADTLFLAQRRSYYRWVAGGDTRMEFSLWVHLAPHRILQEHIGKTIEILTHGGVIQLAFKYFFGYRAASLQYGAAADLKRTSIMHWYKPVEAKRWVLERSNAYQHL